MLALGKKPARADAVKLKFATYFDAKAFPVPPLVIPPNPGWRKWPTTWGMLGNDTVGDCVLVDRAHSVMAWRAAYNDNIVFSTTGVLSDYSAVTGYDPRNPSTDQGTDVQEAASYCLKTGVIDAAGKRHKIGAYVSIPIGPGDIDRLAFAISLLGVVTVGVRLTSSCYDQFGMDEPWTPVRGSPFEGGHCITCIGRNSRGLFLFVTWNKLIGVSADFLAENMDECVPCLSLEYLNNDKSPQGVDLETLKTDQALLMAAPQPTEKTTMATQIPAKDDTTRQAIATASARKWLTANAPGWVAGEITDAELKSLAVSILTDDDSYRSGQFPA